MKTIKYTKINGAGNDFVLIDRDLNPDLNISGELVKTLSDRTIGIGSDGVIVLKNDELVDFSMRYFNADGSTGSLCGNGARCVIKYAHLAGRIDKSAKFESNGFEYSGELLPNDEIKFYLNQPEKIKLDFKIKAFDQLINASYADVGSPHVVIFINDVLQNRKNLNSFFKDIGQFPVLEIGKSIRFAKEFAPGGTNVNFVSVRENLLEIRSFERGVENETLACGTGAVAAAIIAHLKNLVKTSVQLITKSGYKLKVDFEINGDRFEKLSLTGPVEVEFNGEFSI